MDHLLTQLRKLKLNPLLPVLVGLILTACTPDRFVAQTSTATASPPATATATNTPTLTPTLAVLSSAPTPSPTATIPPRPKQSDTLPTLTPSPTNTPPPGIACLVAPNSLSLQEGPGAGYRAVAQLPLGQEVLAHRRSDTGWLLVTTPQRITGWLLAETITCQQNILTLPLAGGLATPALAATLPLPTFTPEPETGPPGTATPAVPVGRWRGEYFDNPSLLGQPVMTRFDDHIEFNWILDSPDPALIPGDNFSIRWSGIFEFPKSGDYRFFAEVDDGIRLYVDGWLVIDAWHTALPVPYEGRFEDIQAGPHTVVVEYFESGGHAHVKVWHEAATFEDPNWAGEYFDNLTPEGPVAYRESSQTIDFDWGGGAPDSRLHSNNFSVRWERTLFFEGGNYQFFAEIEEKDEVGLTLDGWEIFNEYRQSEGTVTGGFGNLGPGPHTLQLAFQDHGGRAKIKFWWSRQ